ncbi:MAG: tripartite tricarboxylate transporter substrate binding protein [Pseudomonadota bacterium]
MNASSLLNTLAVTAAGAVLFVTQNACAQAGSDYPNRPIRWIVPSPAGAPVDALARKVAEGVGIKLGVPIIVENKPGANGSIGAAEVARAAPDGYTLMFSIPDPLIAAMVTVKGIAYDATKDFKLIAKVTNNPPLLVVGASEPSRNLKELVAATQKQGGNLPYGSWGPGSAPQVIVESLAREAGVRFREIPYRGSPPAMQDMMGGQIAVTITAPMVAKPLIAAGRIRGIAIAGTKRSPLLPDVPTFAESGFSSPIFMNGIWTGLTGPAALPQPVADKLLSAVQSAMREPRMIQGMTDYGAEISVKNSEDFTKELRTEYSAVTKLLKDELKVVPD